MPPWLIAAVETSIPTWAAALIAVVAAVAGFLVKVLPVYSQSLKLKAETDAKDRAEQRAAELEADAQRAKVRLGENQQVFNQQRLIIKQLADQLEEVAKRSDAQAAALYQQIGAIQNEKDRCEERCRQLERRVSDLEAIVAKGGPA